MELQISKEASEIISDPTDKLIVQSLAKLDGVALGVALGTLFGLIVFLATNILILKGGSEIGPNLALLSQYFIGYEVTFGGSLIGLAYGLLAGFVFGWLIAFLRNIIVAIYLHLVKIKRNISAVNEYIDNP
jgi:hypothetical protein